MSLVLMPAGAGEVAVAALAEQVFPLFSQPARSHDAEGALAVGPFHQRLNIARSGQTRYRLVIPAAGRYALFTQHQPAEFAFKFSGARLLHEKFFAAAHEHDQAVSSVSLELSRPLNRKRFEQWLDALLGERGTDLYRMKGFLHFTGSTDRIVIQGVHMLVEMEKLGTWEDGPPRTQLVLIGRKLDADALRTSLAACTE